MNLRNPTTIVDPDKCTGCGICLGVCPSDTLSLINGVAVVTGENSLSCGHCMAVCPTDAIEVKALDSEMTSFETFSLEKKWMKFGDFPTKDLARLIMSRRSCRNFKNNSVEPEILRDLIKLAVFAPSGTNSQGWTFTCLSSRQAVLNFGVTIKQFFQNLNKKAENLFLRNGLKLVGIKALDAYYKEYYASVKTAMDEMENKGLDRLFHGATACILIGSDKKASCPKEDAMLATGNILLAAHTMGLGSCLIGFAVEAMKADKTIQGKIDIPNGENIYAVIALGYPDETYKSITGRKKPIIRFK
ncbi:MAG: nitroreductase [Desulfobacteraceae bacterium]|nr:nitroreductase [Desulfobacteraceae bacterium]